MSARLEACFGVEDTRVLAVGRFVGDLVYVDVATGAEPFEEALVQEALKREYAMVVRVRESGELSFGTSAMGERFAQLTEQRSRDPQASGSARTLPRPVSSGAPPQASLDNAQADALAAALGRVERARDQIDEPMFVLLPDLDRLIQPNTVTPPRVQAVLRQAGALLSVSRGNARSRMIVFSASERARELESQLSAHDYGASPWREVRPGPPDALEIRQFLERVAGRHLLGGNLEATAKLLAQRQQSLKEISTALRARVDQGEHDVSALVGGGYDEAAVARIRAELDQLVGMDDIKGKLALIVEQARQTHAALQRGEMIDPPSIHLALLGRPGTGKSEVADIIGRMLHAAGLRRRDKPVRAGLADIVSEFNPGEVVQKMQRLVNQAAGGVLFIDEAYGLADDRWGTGAVTTLVDEMEKRRADFSVILAGYPERMQDLFAMNAGLRSRIADGNIVTLRDYTPEELCQIADRMIAKRRVSITDDARAAAHAIIRREATRPHANGREVRNRVEAWDAVRIGRGGTRFERADIVDPRATSPDDARRLLAEFDQRFLGVPQVRAWFDSVALRAADALARGQLERAPRLFFTGPPGTGKTETARLLGRFLKAVGVLRDGRSNETSLQDFVGDAHSSVMAKTEKLFEDSRENVLFIDEAYRFAATPDGRAALDQIVQHLTAREYDSVCVVMAGYDQQMRALTDENQGLASRFEKPIPFVWPSDEQLAAITLRRLAHVHGLRPPESERAFMNEALLKNLRAQRASDGFAGARSANTLADEIRVAALGARRPVGECRALDVPDVAVALDNERVAKILEAFDARFIDASALHDAVKRVLARRRQHLKNPQQALAIEVTGPAGTGKSSVVRWLRDTLVALTPQATLRSVERTAMSLKGQHVGVTENNVREAFRDAAGGFLVLDDMHQLVPAAIMSDVYDASAVRTIIEQLRAPENARTTVFIVGRPALENIGDELRALMGLKLVLPAPSALALARMTLRNVLGDGPLVGADRSLIEPELAELFTRRQGKPAFANGRDADSVAAAIRDEALLRDFDDGPVTVHDIVKVLERG